MSVTWFFDFIDSYSNLRSFSDHEDEEGRSTLQPNCATRPCREQAPKKESDRVEPALFIFMQDGALPHHQAQVYDWRNEHFPNRWMGLISANLVAFFA